MAVELYRKRFRLVIELDVAVDDIDPSGSLAQNGHGAPQDHSLITAAGRNLGRQRQLLHRALANPEVCDDLVREEILIEAGEALRDLNLPIEHVSDDERLLAPILAQLDAETHAHFQRAFARDSYAELDSFWNAFRVEYLNVRVEEGNGSA